MVKIYKYLNFFFFIGYNYILMFLYIYQNKYWRKIFRKMMSIKFKKKKYFYHFIKKIYFFFLI
jgi:hypothetical protein